MSQDRVPVVEEEFSLREYLLVLIRWWWVVGLVFAVVVAAALLFSWRSSSVYEARTKLLIVPRVSAQILSQQGNRAQNLSPQGNSEIALGPSLSVETLSALTTANDLLQQIIETLDLRDLATGRYWLVDRLADMMKAKVETAGRAGGQVSLPLLTMTVRGDNPKLLQRVANTWAELFVRQNAQLFAAEAARSYDFILAQYQETQSALLKGEEERRRYTSENRLVLLRDELARKREALDKDQESLLSVSSQLAIRSAELDEALARLRELSVEGRWIGLYDSIDSRDAAFSATSPLQRSVLLARQNFYEAEQRVQGYLLSNELSLVSQRLSLKQDLLRDYTSQLEQAQNTLRVQQRTLQTLEVQLKEQPQFFVLRKAVDDPALWQQLGLNPTRATWERLREQALQTEEVNPAFTVLTDRVIATRSAVETEQERVALLSARVEETRKEVKALEKEISDKETIQLSRLKQALALARQSYEKEREAFLALSARSVELRGIVEALRSQREETERLVNSRRSEADTLAQRTDAVELKVRQLDRQIQVLEGTFKELSSRLQEVRIAKAEQAGSIRVVEAATEPSSPLAPDRQRTVILGGAVGLLLGVLAAFVVHALRGSAPRPFPTPPEQSRG